MMMVLGPVFKKPFSGRKQGIERYSGWRAGKSFPTIRKYRRLRTFPYATRCGGGKWLCRGGEATQGTMKAIILTLPK